MASETRRLASIAEQLHIGVDSILVVDDNVGEISQLRAAHAETPLLHSQSPGQTLFWLRHYPALNGYRANSAAALRVNDLEAAREREHLRTSAASSADYIARCRSKLHRVELEECAREARGAFAKNQSIQHGAAALLRSGSSAQARGTKAVRDFDSDARQILRQRHHRSDFARAEGDRLVIDEVAISCRALGRSIESPMIAMALAPMIELYGLREVSFHFREGPRNYRRDCG